MSGNKGETKRRGMETKREEGREVNCEMKDEVAVVTFPPTRSRPRKVMRKVRRVKLVTW